MDLCRAECAAAGYLDGAEAISKRDPELNFDFVNIVMSMINREYT